MLVAIALPSKHTKDTLEKPLTSRKK